MTSGDMPFDELFEKYHHLAYRTALRILNAPQDAEDVAQDVFLKMWASPTLFRGGNIEKWLTVLARNRALDVVRRRTRDGSLRERSAPRVTPEGIAHACATRIDMQAAFGSLTEDQRVVLNECFFQSLTHAEAAESLGLPSGTVKTRIRAGLRRMRRLELGSSS